MLLVVMLCLTHKISDRLAAIDAKIEGKEVVASTHAEDAPASGQVIDLMAALQAMSH